MDIQTTNIDSLPLQSSGNEDNVQLNTTTKATNSLAKPVTDKLDDNEFITGLQKAASTGMTALPSRDIPHDQTSIQQDHEVKANFIPASQGDYITQHQTTEEIIKQNLNKHLEKNQVDFLYNELAVPFLIVILYFMFQLPAVRKLFVTSLPFCYNHIGDINFTGRIMNAIIFGGVLYAVTKILSISH